MSKSTSGLLVAVALFLACGLAQADQYSDTGFYLSAAVGRNWIQSGIPEKNTTYLKAAAGWQFTPQFAVEAAVNDFGEFPGPTPAYSDFDMDGVSVAAIAQLPLSPNLAVFVRVGSIWWSAESSFFFFNRSGGPNQTGTLDFSESDVFAGLGASYEVMESLELNLEYNRYEFNFSGHGNFDNDNSALVVSLDWEL